MYFSGVRRGACIVIRARTYKRTPTSCSSMNNRALFQSMELSRIVVPWLTSGETLLQGGMVLGFFRDSFLILGFS